MPRGIIETLGLAGTVLLAAPVALLGVEFLVGGRLGWAGAFLGIAALMLLLPRYARTPEDAATEAVEGVVGTVVKTEDEEE